MHWLKNLLKFVPGQNRIDLRRESHRKAKDLAELVNALYRLAFGRVADEAGLVGNVARLEAGTPLEVLAEDLVRSNEFRGRHGSNQSVDCEYLTALYRDGLGRGPDPQGLASWLAEGKKGATRAHVLAAMARSVEALEKARLCGSDSTSQPQRVDHSLLVPPTVPKGVLPAEVVSYSVDQFSIFDDVLHLKGWVFHSTNRVSSINFVSDGKRRFSLLNFNLESPDVAAVYGAAAQRARFSEVRRLAGDEHPKREAGLSILLSDRSEILIPSIGQAELRNEPVYILYGLFLEQLRTMAPGHFLEIGSRARSNIVRKDLIPGSWHYTGFDILPGENVDVVGDAHHLSKLLPHGHFRAVWALSVFEHILMPWKLVIELNKVMEIGGIGYFATHQTWPLHDRPWDFGRFSSDAWKGLLNNRTGFQIIDVQMGEPAFIVANRWHPAVDFGECGYLASAVMFKKISETTLTWDIDPAELLVEAYPA